jgi:hypothetical protein
VDGATKLKLLAARAALLGGSILTTWFFFQRETERAPAQRTEYVAALWIGGAVGVILGTAYYVYRRRKGGRPERRPRSAAILAVIGVGVTLQTIDTALVVGLVAMFSAIVVIAAVSPGTVAFSMGKEGSPP